MTQMPGEPAGMWGDCLLHLDHHRMEQECFAELLSWGVRNYGDTWGVSDLEEGREAYRKEYEARLLNSYRSTPTFRMMTEDELLQKEERILAKLGWTWEELQRRVHHGAVTSEEMDAYHTIQGLRYLRDASTDPYQEAP